MARFVFHIGWPETGATNVQACFDLNKDAFQRAGILYPRFARSRGTHLSLAPHLFGLAGNARRIVPVDPEAIYPSLMQEAEAARCSTIFLSSERFCQARTFNATLLDPFRRHEVVVAACLRRQDYWINSAIAQGLGRRKPHASIDHVVANAMRHAGYFRYLKSWQSFFGGESVRLFPLRSGEDSLRRMLGYLKAPADIVAAKAEETPLGFESTMFMWMAAELLKPARDQQDRMVRVLRDMDAANSPQRAFLFSREFRQSLFDRFSEMNREMFATFATDIPGATFEENLDDIDDYVYREPSGFSEAEFREKLAIVESEIAKKSGASFHQGVGQPAGRRKPKPAAKRRQGRADGPEVLRSDMAAQRGTAVKKRVSSTSISAGPAPGTGGGPDFLGIGAAKAGTGWLYDQLALHPEVWMPPIKELHYFANETRQHAFGPRISSIMVKTLSRFQRQYDRDRCASLNAKRIKMFNKPLDERDIIFLKLATTPETAAGLDAYANFFSLKGDALSGEITPAYSTLKPAVVKEINERFPRLKLVFLARDPIGRALSHLQLYRRQADANPTGPFRDFDLQNVDSIRAVLGKENTDVRSRPTETIRRWRQFFPAEQLHIELFDDLGSDAAGVRARIFRFLGISPEKGGEAIPADFNRKSTQTKYPITPQARDLLIELYRDEILACAEAFGGAAKTWPAKYGLA